MVAWWSAATRPTVVVAAALAIRARLLLLIAIAAGAPPAGDGAADTEASVEQIEWLVETYGRLIFRVAFAVTRNEALAEEVVQDTMVKAWKSMPSWEGNQPVKWLRTVARNGAITVMRKEGRSVAADRWDDTASTAADVERQVEGRSLVEAMRDALGALDETSRTLLILRETDDLSYAEIAEVVDLTPSAVKAKLYRARHELKELLRGWDL